VSATVSLTGAVVRTVPAGAPRGTVLVLPGRGDDPAYYSRLATRLAADGYAVDVARDIVSSSDDAVAVWAAQNVEGLRVVIGVDSSAGFVATALAERAFDPAPAGVVFAGAGVPGAAVGDGDELAFRSACPVHRGVVLAAGAEPLAASEVQPTWPAGRSSIPVLALHGAADPISPVDDVAPLYAGWNGERVTVAGGLHDVLNDVHHRSVAAEIVSFLERLRLDPSAAPILVKESTR
jgi:pimeloyl-ACP methyl ester carboxylesterase